MRLLHHARQSAVLPAFGGIPRLGGGVFRFVAGRRATEATEADSHQHEDKPKTVLNELADFHFSKGLDHLP